MYLIIEEDGKITTSETITEAIQEALEEGVCSVVNTDDNTELSQSGEWEPLEECDWA